VPSGRTGAAASATLGAGGAAGAGAGAPNAVPGGGTGATFSGASGASALPGVGGPVAVLRVHRHGYHSLAAIQSELAWVDALRAEAGVRTPRVLPAADGRRVVTVTHPDDPEPRACVLFEYVPGCEPPQDRLVEGFGTLGALTARMHRHARAWTRPVWFTRFHWDCDAAFGTGAQPGRWGRWQDGIGVGAAERALLGRLETTIRARLARYGRSAERYGLIHGDLRLANLLVDSPADGPVDSRADSPATRTATGTATGTAIDEPTVIDFDDSGFGWYVSDLAAALSFIEDHPRVDALIAAWLAGYRTVAELSAADEAEVPTFVMFRRLLLTAWIGSHPAAEIAQELGASYTHGTCDLAERYLTTHE
jgi:Ser/Thr protein kinase RdoA (MazF antagonist)